MPSRLTSITFTSGEILSPSENFTILVGPNNAGKSATLLNIWGQISRNTNSPMVGNPIISDYELQYPTIAEVEAKLTAVSPVRPPGQYPQGIMYEPNYVTRQNSAILESRVNQIIQNQGTKCLAELTPMFVAMLTPEARLGQLSATPVPDLSMQEPSSPVQIIWANREVEKLISDYAKRAFGFEITVNRYSGSMTRLHVGKPLSPEEPLNIRSQYSQELRILPEVTMQSHGVQAFLGMVATLATAAFDIILIDEPEAFLHPPQARLLGEIFVELSRRGSQIIVSTHSDDFLQGVLRAAGATADVTLARLTRPQSNQNSIAQIAPPEVKRLYDDPLLRYSHVLSGIFYRGTVLCEAESDCNYYSAVLDNKFATEDEAVRRPDLLFAQCGGKDRLPRAVEALKTMKSPTAVIADIDVIADEGKFQLLFTTLGGNWQTISADYAILKASVNSRTVSPQRAATKIVVDQIFEAHQENALTREQVEDIRDATKISSGWSQLKEGGSVVVPSGPPAVAYDNISVECESIGLFLVAVGELEGWHRQYGRLNKQAWLRQVFENKDFENSNALPLLERVTGFIESRQ